MYKRAGVDLVKEHVRATLPATANHFDVVPGGLEVWYGPREAPPMVYDFVRGTGDVRPRSRDRLSPAVGPTLSADALLFSRVRLTWQDWLKVWDADRAGLPLPRFGPPDGELVLLPAIIHATGGSASEPRESTAS